MLHVANKFLAIKFSLYDGNDEVVLRVESGKENGRALYEMVSGSEVAGFFPGLQLPVVVGSTISAEQYGNPVEGAPNNGNIVFYLNPEDLNLSHWFKGRNFWIYQGSGNDEFEDMELVYSGKVDDLGFNFIENIYTVKITDQSLLLDVPLVAEVYHNVSHILDIEVLSGVLEKEIFGDTLLTGPESTAPGIVFSGDVVGVPIITFAEGFNGVIQVVNETVSGGALTLFISGGVNTVNLPNSSGLALFANGGELTLADGSSVQTIKAGLIGLSKPRLYGEMNSIEPLMKDEVTETWRISTTALSSVSEVSVGGEIWEEMTGTPTAGKWSVDLNAGTMRLGSPTLGSEVRVNAKAVGYGTLTTKVLAQLIVEEKGGAVDEDSMIALEASAPYLIGFYTSTSAINTKNALDQIFDSIGGWWDYSTGLFRGGVLAAPDESASVFTLTEVEIVTFDLNNIIPRAWRIRVQFKPNFRVLTNPLPGVTEEERVLKMAEGFMAEDFSDVGVLSYNPKAIDVPIIRSLVLNETDANDIRDRLSEAWGVDRKVFTVVYNGDILPNVYDTVKVEYGNFSGYFRVHSVSKSLGSGAHTLVLWG